MFVFKHLGNEVSLMTDGCFEPNLTTKIMLSATVQELKKIDNQGKSFIEIGCGCGVISTFMMKHGYLQNIRLLGMSDLSNSAIKAAKINIQNNNITNAPEMVKYKVGSGLEPWLNESCDFIVNDISAISEGILHMNSWFDNAPNNSGLDGIDNTISVIKDFNKNFDKEQIMLFPVLSLSNVKKLFKEIDQLDLGYEKLTFQSWPLPSIMITEYKDELKKLKSYGHIDFAEKFGQYIIQTACYKIWKK